MNIQKTLLLGALLSCVSLVAVTAREVRVFNKKTGRHGTVLIPVDATTLEAFKDELVADLLEQTVKPDAPQAALDEIIQDIKEDLDTYVIADRNDKPLTDAGLRKLMSATTKPEDRGVNLLPGSK